MRQMKTFEFALWKIKSEKVELLHSHTNQQFIDEFLELFVDLSNRYLNMMIAGDFYIQYFHIENKNVEVNLI